MSVPLILDGNGNALKKNTDYILSYEPEEMPEDGGIVSVIAEGTGNYTGTLRASYRVKSDMLSIKSASVKYTGDGESYRGDAPVAINAADITVQLGKGNVLQPGTPWGSKKDYEIVSYSGNLKKGTAKVTIRGTGDYTGIKTVPVKISEKKGED